ncbi:extracellular solute-binding protein [Pseudothauera nasutitermitis]|uniref:Extracellular solute-binding protein n=1 Tax=Pseudothauera nasutitermitis TaxID=2565930 RepID=A0A4S4AX91_9RHOO|nr:extracellular solute-binding protein [Pseudothauera nasutitermitis]THF64707.1 extracellular solute-binding protein [Pseudothauera nasutitermitis]
MGVATPDVLPGRRRVLAALGGGALLCGLAPLARAQAAPSPVVVLTSYPEEMMSRFEAAFERAHPQYRLQLRWRRPSDALTDLLKPGQDGVDVYWAASPRTFERLKETKALQTLGIDLSGLPAKLGGTRISDVDGLFVATELAGYGYVYAPAELARLGVPVPQDWRDLADPRLAGRIALPDPSRVGFAPVLVDIVLQAYGWEAGWALWSEIAGLSTLIRSGGGRVAEEVGPGRAAIGLSIDFFVAAAIAGGAPLRFAYPLHGGINPAHVALTAGAPNPAGGRAFAAFLLSEEGQRLLAAEDIRKLPVRPSVYATLPAGYHDPFAAAAAGGYAYDNEAGRARLTLVATLFAQMFIQGEQGHERYVALWSRIHAAERAGRDLRQIRALLGTPPLSERAAADPALLALFRERFEGESAELERIEVGWQWEAVKAWGEAERRLAALGA